MGDDLISRSALLAELSSKLTIVELLGVAEIVGDIPTVEAESVVHAHWVVEGYPEFIPKCSRCEKRGSFSYPRCPHCGAHMDEEVAR